MLCGYYFLCGVNVLIIKIIFDGGHRLYQSFLVLYGPKFLSFLLFTNTLFLFL